MAEMVKMADAMCHTVTKGTKLEADYTNHETRSLPGIEYNRREKIYEEEVLAKDEDVRAFSFGGQQDHYPCAQPLHPGDERGKSLLYMRQKSDLESIPLKHRI